MVVLNPRHIHKFFDEVHKLLVLLNELKVKYALRSILKNSSNIAKVHRFEGPDTLKEIIIKSIFHHINMQHSLVGNFLVLYNSKN